MEKTENKKIAERIARILFTAGYNLFFLSIYKDESNVPGSFSVKV